jgi:hypothetical protein
VGQHRDDYAFQFATFLVRDLGLSDSDALAWLEEWDARNAVPKGARRLQEILNNAHAYGQRAYGAGLQSLAPVRRGKGRSTARAPIRFSVEI